jgi:predicted dehydrogenase
MNKIGVGIVGASPERGWAAWAHIPALQALPQYEIRAVSTSRRESAEAAQQVYRVDAFDNPQDLVRHDGVDLVVVSVKVPNHYPVVMAGIEAGKMVYCEWPLGMNTGQAMEMASRARQAGVRTVVGLQGRFSPQVQHARRLVEDGYVGEVLSTCLVGSGIAWGDVTPRAAPICSTKEMAPPF